MRVHICVLSFVYVFCTHAAVRMQVYMQLLAVVDGVRLQTINKPKYMTKYCLALQNPNRKHNAKPRLVGKPGMEHTLEVVPSLETLRTFSLLVADALVGML